MSFQKDNVVDSGMRYLKVLYKVSDNGTPYLKAYNQLGQAIIGVWTNSKVPLKDLFSGKEPNKTYSILGYYNITKEKDDKDKDFVLINYINKVYDYKTKNNNNVPF